MRHHEISVGDVNIDPQRSQDGRPRKGALLVYAMKDTTDGADPTRMFGFRLFLPGSAIPPGQAIVRFRAKQTSKQAGVENTDQA